MASIHESSNAFANLMCKWEGNRSPPLSLLSYANYIQCSVSSLTYRVFILLLSQQQEARRRVASELSNQMSKVSKRKKFRVEKFTWFDNSSSSCSTFASINFSLPLLHALDFPSSCEISACKKNQSSMFTKRCAVLLLTPTNWNIEFSWCSLDADVERM